MMATSDTANERFTDTFPFENLPAELKKEIIKLAIPQGLSLAMWEYWSFQGILAQRVGSAAPYVNIDEEPPTSFVHIRDQLRAYAALCRVKKDMSAEARGT
jgi:hypothetical protein